MHKFYVQMFFVFLEIEFDGIMNSIFHGLGAYEPRPVPRLKLPAKRPSLREGFMS